MDQILKAACLPGIKAYILRFDERKAALAAPAILQLFDQRMTFLIELLIILILLHPLIFRRLEEI